MNFDASSAVALDDKAVNTTSFDINSAHDEPQLRASQSPFVPTKMDSAGVSTLVKPVSGFVEFLHNIFNSPIDELNRNAYMYTHQDEIPTPVKGESMTSYIKRAQPSLDNYEAPKLKEGVLAQVQGPMDLAMASGVMAAPVLTAKIVGGLAVIDHFFNARNLLNKYAPDTPPEIKDAAEIVSMGLEAHALGVSPDLYKLFIEKKMAVTNTPDATYIPPDILKNLNDFDSKTGEGFAESLVIQRPVPYVKASQAEWPSPEIETPTGTMQGGVLSKLGVTQEHYDAAITADLPVKVPLLKVYDVAQQPNWESVKEILSPIQEKPQGVLDEKTQTQADGQEVLKEAQPENIPADSQETVKVSREQLPVGTGQEKASGLEARIKQNLESVPEGVKSEISNYQEMSKSEQLKAASQYVTENPEEALAVLKGEKAAPEGLLHNSIALALEEHATNENDANLVLKLASLRSTRAGQEISMLTERNPNSPITYFDELQKRKIESLGDKDSAIKIREKETEKIRKSIKKPSKGDWTSFIESIKC